MRRRTQTEPFSFRLPFKDKTRLEKLSEADQVHMSDLIRESLKVYLDFRESQKRQHQ